MAVNKHPSGPRLTCVEVARRPSLTVHEPVETVDNLPIPVVQLTLFLEKDDSVHELPALAGRDRIGVVKWVRKS